MLTTLLASHPQALPSSHEQVLLNSSLQGLSALSCRSTRDCPRVGPLSDFDAEALARDTVSL
jgi:hypothetical protein